MRRSLLLTIIMVLTLMLGLVGVAGAAGTFAPQSAPVQQTDETATPTDGDTGGATDEETATPVTGGEEDEEDATPTSPAGLPDTGAGGGLNIALLGVLGAVALGIAGIALLTSGRKSESES